MPNEDICLESLLSVSQKIKSGEITSSKLTQLILGRIARTDSTYKSYVTVVGERALQKAEQADKEIAAGMWRGPLHGIPLAVKDLYYTSYAKTTWGTTIYKDFVPNYNATVVDRMEIAGGVMLGKLKTTEGATIACHPDVPTPVNPWNKERWAGASSNGSGVATAAGLCYGSLGSDTGGSIRYPSAANGLSGIKPTWGRVSRYGVFPLADSLDHVGPMCRTVLDSAALLGVIAGADPNDPTCLQDEVPNYLAVAGQSIRGLRIGVCRAYSEEGVDPQVVAALHDAENILKSLGATIVEVKFPDYTKLLSLWDVSCGAETAVAHKETYPSRKSEYGSFLATFIDSGLASTALDFVQNVQNRLVFCGELNQVFAKVDVLIIPTLPYPTPLVTEIENTGPDTLFNAQMFQYTAPFDFSGSPTITVPNGIDKNGLPLSMQFVGKHLSEPLLVKVASAFQQVTDWHTKRPTDLL